MKYISIPVTLDELRYLHKQRKNTTRHIRKLLGLPITKQERIEWLAKNLWKNRN